ncbi:MAG: thioesterase family protein [Pseudomonadota bacterium]
MKSERLWPVAAPFVQNRTVVTDDIDEFGHVNNVRYIDWAMDAAWVHSDALNLSFSEYRRLGVGCVVWRHEFDYVAAALEGDDVEIATWIAENDNRVRLRRAFEMRRARDGAILFRGKTVFVTVDMETGKPARMPEEFIKGYKPAE